MDDNMDDAPSTPPSPLRPFIPLPQGFRSPSAAVRDPREGTSGELSDDHPANQFAIAPLIARTDIARGPFTAPTALPSTIPFAGPHLPHLPAMAPTNPPPMTLLTAQPSINPIAGPILPPVTALPSMAPPASNNQNRMYFGPPQYMPPAPIVPPPPMLTPIPIIDIRLDVFAYFNAFLGHMMVWEPELRERIVGFHVARAWDNYMDETLAIYYEVQLHFAPEGYNAPPTMLLGHPFRLYPTSPEFAARMIAANLGFLGLPSIRGRIHGQHVGSMITWGDVHHHRFQPVDPVVNPDHWTTWAYDIEGFFLRRIHCNWDLVFLPNVRGVSKKKKANRAPPPPHDFKKGGPEDPNGGWGRRGGGGGGSWDSSSAARAANAAANWLRP